MTQIVQFTREEKRKDGTENKDTQNDSVDPKLSITLVVSIQYRYPNPPNTGYRAQIARELS